MKNRRYLVLRYRLKKHGLQPLSHWPETFSINQGEDVKDVKKWLSLNIIRAESAVPLLAKIARENLKI